MYIKKTFNIKFWVLLTQLCGYKLFFSFLKHCLLTYTTRLDVRWEYFYRGEKSSNKNIKYIYICTLKQIVGSRINRLSTVVALMKAPNMHLCSFCLALALQWLMQPIKCRK